MSASSTPATADLIVGIDLGTTNSLVAFCDERGPRVLADQHGHALLPSVVRFDTDGRVIVGREARATAVASPQHTVASVKRLMGRGFADVQADLPHLSYEVRPGENDTVRIHIPGMVDDRADRTPQEISALILRTLKEQAEQALRLPRGSVRRAVVTVPAFFDDAQRQATRDAGRLAGLDVVRIVNEPTAAALAYGIGQRATPGDKAETIAVYDLGGGTFDVSILLVTPPEPQTTADPGTTESFFQVLSTAGDTHLGGDDVDRMIVELVLREIREEFGRTLEFPPSTRQAVRDFAEAAKIRLSEHDSAALAVDLGDGRVYRRTLSRIELEAMIRPWLDRTLEACGRALRDARLNPSDIDRIVMVGGCTRMPLVRSAVGEFFQREPYTALNPDEVVALGASVQASILAGSNRDMLLLDVIPLSVGIETVGGGVAKLVMRNTTVPTRATEMFSTGVDGQVSVKIHVVQGERELVKDCRSLGEFHLAGIPPMPAGIPQIEVEFLVDANGILNVSAVEKRSGKRAAIQVVPRYGLTRAEVDRLEAEAFAHAKADMHAHRVIDLATESALNIKWIREAMERVGEELAPDYRAVMERRLAELEGFITAARRDVAAVDAGAFHQAKETLDRESMRLHEVAIAQSLRSLS